MRATGVASLLGMAGVEADVKIWVLGKTSGNLIFLDVQLSYLNISYCEQNDGRDVNEIDKYFVSG